MLTAAAHGKLKRRLDLYEDEVTSCIFGAMQHLPIGITWKIFKRLFKDAKIHFDFSNSSLPDRVEFEFWPKWATGSGHVEPDLVVHFFNGWQPLFHVITEVKWNATLSPPCELVRQWRHRQPVDTANWIHLYLVKDSAKGWKELNESLLYFDAICPDECFSCEDRNKKKGLTNGRVFYVYEWNEILGCVGWRHVVNVIRDISRDHDDWVKGVSVFFEKQGIVPFIGFTWLYDEDIGYISSEEEVFFHRKPWFAFLTDMVINRDETNTAFFVRGE